MSVGKQHSGKVLTSNGFEAPSVAVVYQESVAGFKRRNISSLPVELWTSVM